MTRFYRMLAVGFALSAIAAVAGPIRPAAAQNLDTPSVTIIKRTPHHMWIQVTAGASGAPAGVYVEWMYEADFQLYGTWAVYPDPALYYCGFNTAVAPSRHSSGGMTTFALGPNQSMVAVVGDLFDEPGASDNYAQELPPATGVVVRAHAKTDGTHGDSPNCGDDHDSSDNEHNQCTHSQGYWKTHPGVWPTATLALGTVSYSAAQLLSILTKPAMGNGLIILCHQLIATKLNIAGGADAALISGSVAAADALIGSLVCPPVGTDTLSPSAVESLSDALDDWNEGEAGPVQCNTTPVETATWGRLKTLYR